MINFDPYPVTPYLHAIMEGLFYRKELYDWITTHIEQAESIATFGCAGGEETFAFLWALGASEAIGIDKDEGSIKRARELHSAILAETNKSLRDMTHQPESVSTNVSDWWNTRVVDFGRTGILKQDPKDIFVVGDITQPTNLLSNHYDIALVEYVLYHIWPNENGVRQAIAEMARIVKPAGIVAALEVVQYGDNPRVNFETLFEQTGLRQLFPTEEFPHKR